MKKPTLEEVKEYFKDAVVVIPIAETAEVDITKNIKTEIHEWLGCYWIDISNFLGTSVLLWDDNLGYAKILTYKEKLMKYEITKEQILQIVEWGNPKHAKMVREEWFPEAFKNKLNKNHTGCIKTKKCGDEKWLMFFEDGILKYGFDSNRKWFLPNGIPKIRSNDIEATESEVFEALKGEAVRRGFKNGDVITDILMSGTVELNRQGFEFIKNELWLGDCVLFKDGKWAEIIPVKEMTHSDIENVLGYKIKIV